ncbi:MAG TPA: hypothetical protein VIU62_08775 [Chloroflexota bacterium]
MADGARREPSWRVLLLGGSSGTGKSTLAPQLARHFDVPWLEADDFRLAMQRATTPATHPALHFFLSADMVIRQDFWRLSPEEFRDGLISVGEVVSHALELVVRNHVAQGRPMVLEGDGILPAMAALRLFAGLEVGDAVRAVFLVESDSGALLLNMRARSLDGATPDPALRNYARASWLYGLWLGDQAFRHGLPVLEARPYETLLSRTLLTLA